jgi:hypothetical protein
MGNLGFVVLLICCVLSFVAAPRLARRDPRWAILMFAPLVGGSLAIVVGTAGDIETIGWPVFLLDVVLAAIPALLVGWIALRYWRAARTLGGPAQVDAAFSGAMVEPMIVWSILPLIGGVIVLVGVLAWAVFLRH